MSELYGWRYVHASTIGVAHLAEGIECQGACAVQQLSTPELGTILILAAADGAGSAARSRTGAQLACQTFLAECASRLLADHPLDWTETTARDFFESVRCALIQQAAAENLPLREFACTLLGAVVVADHALFLQIGDGVIVLGAEDEYRPVFWPQTGQYVNETRFVTDPDAATYLAHTVTVEPVVEIALLTDGLQMLALHYHHRQAHAPFFRPVFQQLRTHSEPGCPASLMSALEEFLASPADNQRTHDDKTLVLATRLPPLAPTHPADEPDAMASMSTPMEPKAIAARETAAVDSSSPTPTAPAADLTLSDANPSPDASDATSAALVRENNGDKAL